MMKKKKRLKASIQLENNQPVPQCLAKRKKIPKEVPKEILESAEYSMWSQTRISKMIRTFLPRFHLTDPQNNSDKSWSDQTAFYYKQNGPPEKIKNFTEYISINIHSIKPTIIPLVAYTLLQRALEFHGAYWQVSISLMLLKPLFLEVVARKKMFLFQEFSWHHQ